jgi:hypothetical protein
MNRTRRRLLKDRRASIRPRRFDDEEIELVLGLIDAAGDLSKDAAR